MHRWFRFCATIALINTSITAFPGGVSHAAEDTAQQATPDSAPASVPPEAEDFPTPGKHQLRATPLQVAQHRIERLGKQLQAQQQEIDGLKATAQAQQEQTEQKTKKIEELEEKLASTQTHLATLEGQITQLSGTLEELQEGIKNSAVSAKARHNTHLPASAPEPPTSESAAPPAAQKATEVTIAHDGPVHVVKRGENLISIARQYGTTAAAIMELNKIKDERKLQIGQSLAIPTSPKTEAKPETTTTKTSE